VRKLRTAAAEKAEKKEKKVKEKKKEKKEKKEVIIMQLRRVLPLNKA